MKKEYVSPAVEIIDVELAGMLAASDSIEITDDTTTTPEARQMLIFNLSDD